MRARHSDEAFRKRIHKDIQRKTVKFCSSKRTEQQCTIHWCAPSCRTIDMNNFLRVVEMLRRLEYTCDVPGHFDVAFSIFHGIFCPEIVGDS